MANKMKIKYLGDILGKLDATNDGPAQATARYTLGRLFPASAAVTDLDVQVLADTLEAYAYLLRTSGVIPDGETPCLTEEH